jgi:RNA polymerase sigma factor (TIGR02999 family)
VDSITPARLFAARDRNRLTRNLTLRVFRKVEMSEPAGDVTRLLIAYSNGDRRALHELWPLVYDELRRIAASYLRAERRDHTLQPTALVHEAYLRLVNQHSVNWRNRAQFYSLSAKMMRRILINYAVARRAGKRGGGAEQIALDEAAVSLDELHVDLLALDEALAALAGLDAEKARLVEMKFFAGMTTREISEVVGRSTATIEREWAFARGWLYQRLAEGEERHRADAVSE